MPADEALERHHRLHEAAESRDLAKPGSVAIGVLAIFLAIVTMLADRSAVETVVLQGKANDHWNSYQTAIFQQHVDLDVAGMLRAIATGDPSASRALRAEAARLEARVPTQHRREQSRTARLARHEEHQRDVAESKHRGYQYAQSGLEVAIVLASVAIMIRMPWLLWAGGVTGVVSALFAAGVFFSPTGFGF